MRFEIFSNQSLKDYFHILNEYDIKYENREYSIYIKSLEDLMELQKKIIYPIIINGNTMEIADHL